MTDRARILAGYDGSPAARSAVALAGRLAAATSADLVAVTTFPRVPLAMSPGAAPLADASLEEGLHDVARRLLDELDDPAITERRVLAGAPAHVLAAEAERRGAALIAVGATHHGRLGRTAPGSVGERLVHGAPCAVLVVPERAGDREIRTVAVAVDGGEESRVALAAARRHATLLGARLALYRVHEPTPMVGTGWSVPVVYDLMMDEERARLDAELLALAAEAGAQLRVLEGDPGRAMAAACAEDGVDLLVCGSRRRGPARAVLVGSVSRHLVDHAPCAVLVVPRGVSATDRPVAEHATA